MIITSDDFNVQFDSTKNDYITCISKDDLKIIRIDQNRVGVFDPTARQENNKRLEIRYDEVASPTFANVDELYAYLVGLKNSAGSSQYSLKSIADSIAGGGFTGISENLLQVDSEGTTTYIGYAVAGSLTSASVWAIKRIVETGLDVAITWADGNKNYDNIWDNRASLTYS